ncbi:MAG: hypothetical protein EOM59_14635 [Clostridia bacterium]|nr:hypothetical protein [Clostridia bacterium]
MPVKIAAVRVEDIPRIGFLRRREMEALFNRKMQTIKKWADAGLIPQPVNRDPRYKDILGNTTDSFWDAQSVWAAFERMRRNEAA